MAYNYKIKIKEEGKGDIELEGKFQSVDNSLLSHKICLSAKKIRKGGKYHYYGRDVEIQVIRRK